MATYNGPQQEGEMRKSSETLRESVSARPGTREWAELLSRVHKDPRAAELVRPQLLVAVEPLALGEIEPQLRFLAASYRSAWEVDIMPALPELLRLCRGES